MKANKHIVNGKVAILVSRGYGTGWSSWARNGEEQDLLFDADIVKAVLAEDFDTVEYICSVKYPDFNTDGIDGLEVHWLDVGTIFRIVEYVGAEIVEIFDKSDYITA
jgi:hypothetical protein